MELKINMVAVLVAVVVNFFLGYLWFSVLFRKSWAKEMGFDHTNMKPDNKVMAKGMIFNIIGSFLFAFVFSHNIAAWRFVPGSGEMNPLSSALAAAIFTWLGFYFPGDLGSTVWENKSWKLFGINTGYSLVSLLVVALILTHWT